MRRTVVIALLVSAAVAPVAAAQALEPVSDLEPSARAQMREGVERLIEGLDRVIEMIDRLPRFAPPEFTPEGDIILRRIEPPPPERRPPLPGGRAPVVEI